MLGSEPEIARSIFAHRQDRVGAKARDLGERLDLHSVEPRGAGGRREPSIARPVLGHAEDGGPAEVALERSVLAPPAPVEAAHALRRAPKPQEAGAVLE